MYFFTLVCLCSLPAPVSFLVTGRLILFPHFWFPPSSVRPGALITVLLGQLLGVVVVVAMVARSF